MCFVVNMKNQTCDIYIGRDLDGSPGDFGNPFKVGIHGKRGECIRLFRAWFYSPEGDDYRKRVREKIKPGMRLGCFCSPKPCHGDVIAEYVNNGYRETLLDRFI